MMGAYRLEKGNKGCFSPFSLTFAPFPLLAFSTHPKGVRCPVGVDVFGVDFRAKWGFFWGGFPLLDTLGISGGIYGGAYKSMNP